MAARKVYFQLQYLCENDGLPYYDKVLYIGLRRHLHVTFSNYFMLIV